MYANHCHTDVIHTVGPIYFDYSKQEAEEKLQLCYTSILALCEKHKLKTIVV